MLNAQTGVNGKWTDNMFPKSKDIVRSQKRSSKRNKNESKGMIEMGLSSSHYRRMNNKWEFSNLRAGRKSTVQSLMRSELTVLLDKTVLSEAFQEARWLIKTVFSFNLNVLDNFILMQRNNKEWSTTRKLEKQQTPSELKLFQNRHQCWR